MLQCNRFDSSLPINALLQREGNRVTYSSFHHCEVEQYHAATYSIKYVLQGTEHYIVKGKKFPVSEGHFLLVNNDQPIDFYIRSRKKVNGFCIHLEEGLLREMYAQLQWGEERLLDTPFEKPSIPPFEEILYAEGENGLGAYLHQLARSFDPANETIAVEPPALYYRLSQHLLEVQNSFPKGARMMGMAKNSTKQELVRRLEMAREVLDGQDGGDLNIEAVAQGCALSGSHLYRSFKKLYGVSPYQYLLQRRIERAAALLSSGEMSATEVAMMCGFGDGASFSKAFKKVRGVSPRAFSPQGTREAEGFAEKSNMQM